MCAVRTADATPEVAGELELAGGGEAGLGDDTCADFDLLAIALSEGIWIGWPDSFALASNIASVPILSK